MQQSATDPKTGQIDMDIIATGIAQTSAERVREISDFIKKVQVSLIVLLSFEVESRTNAFLSFLFSLFLCLSHVFYRENSLKK